MASSRGEGLEGLDKVGAGQGAVTALVQYREVSSVQNSTVLL